MKTITKARTRTEDIRHQLADEIVRGDLAPGLPLDETGLASRFGVSRTPVREALRQLETSGLVEQRPHRGSVVAKPTPERLQAMFEAMAELEAICAGLAAGRMTAPERRGLDEIHASLEDLVRRGAPQRYHEVNQAFHAAIYDGSHNPYLAELTRHTRERLAPFRRAQFRTLGRLAGSHREHTLVVEAIHRGDRDGAMAAMRSHILTVGAAFEQYRNDVG